MQIPLSTIVTLVLLWAQAQSRILSEKRNSAETAASQVSDHVLSKREFSLNGDLRTLAQMLYFQHHRRNYVQPKFASIRKKLFELGKRGSPEAEVASENETANNDVVGSDIEKRQILSVNGALSSLADMLAANGRRQHQEEMTLNRQRLLGLGK